jgi:hypothetical protein
VLLGPVYAVLMLGMYAYEFIKKKYKIFSFVCMYVLFYLTSLSTTELGKLAGFNLISWKHNLRAIGPMLFFILGMFSIYNKKIKILLSW